jgi:hypothetical protein
MTHPTDILNSFWTFLVIFHPLIFSFLFGHIFSLLYLIILFHIVIYQMHGKVNNYGLCSMRRYA